MESTSEFDWIFSARSTEATAFPQSVASEQPELRGGKPDGSHGSIADVTSRCLALNHNPVYIYIYTYIYISVYRNGLGTGLGLLRSELRKSGDQIWSPEVDHPQIPSVCWSRRLTATDSPPMLAWQGMMEWYHTFRKSAHTALAVKACLLGGNSNTKCSMTFVNIAVAISALAGGGPKNGFAPRPAYGGVLDFFRGFLGVWAQEGIETEFWVILVAFWQWKNGQKWKKHCTQQDFARFFGCQSIANTAKTSVLDWRYSKKRVNYRMLDWKHYKNTVKSNVLEGFTAFMAKNV